MSAIDFQNGFICGLATRGLTKGIPDVKVISIENGYDGSPMTWIVMTLDSDLQSIVSSENLDSFRIVGYQDWNVVIYPVLEVLRLDTNKIALRTNNFENVDLALEIHYVSLTGTVLLSSGAKLNDLVGIFNIAFTKPKIKFREMVAYINAANSGSVSQSVMIGLLSDVVANITETISYADVSTVGSVSTTVTLSVL